MSTSGTITFTMSTIDIVTKAFSKLGVKIAEQELEAHEFQDGIDSLNLLIKSWAAHGLHLWAKDEGVLFLEPGKSDYLVGATGDKACQLDDFIGTTTTSGKTPTSTVFQVVDTTGMATGDSVGIELDDNTRHWSTILTVDSPTQITLVVGIPSASKSGSTAFTFTNMASRPQRILSFRRKTFANDNEIPVITWSRDEYFNQINKLSKGTVVNAYYSPQLGNGRVYVWQTSSSANDLLRYTFERQLEDVTTDTDNLDFPQEWLLPIIYNLADLLADDYDVTPAKMQIINTKASAKLDDILGWDEEMTSLFIQPDFD
ncbi:MAG TPA: hypothetical protein EYN54_11970 [Methylococcaceae bacterium]|nr:hypothetical protein [Methylococcaceae bacterium]